MTSPSQAGVGARVHRAPAGAWLLATAATAVLASLALGATLVTRVPVLVAFASWAGVLVVAGALASGRSGGVGWGVAVVAAAWALCIVLQPDGAAGALHPSPVLVAPGLLVAAELAYWSLEPGTRSPLAGRSGPAVARRVTDLGAAALATAAGAGAVLGVASVSSGGGVGLEAVGVTAVLLLLSAIVALAGRTRTPPQ